MWKNIIKERDSSNLNSEEELTNLEKTFNIKVSDDHKFFLTSFGEGVVYNHYRVFGAKKILDEAKGFQERWGEFFLWDSTDSVLNESELKDAVIIADTFNSDELVLIPSRPEEIFYLPADDDCILNLGKGLEQAILKLVQNLQKEIETYDKEEQEEWDLRPVFNYDSF